jgi:hypothetical protein
MKNKSKKMTPVRKNKPQFQAPSYMQFNSFKVSHSCSSKAQAIKSYKVQKVAKTFQ